jgi:hypothetical protein
MRRAVLVALAFSIIASGCAHPHARKPAAELRAGREPTTRPVRHDATYALTRIGGVGEPLATARVLRDECVGFRREADGSVVAVAGNKSYPMPDGEFAWVLVPGTGPTWRERAGADCKDAAAKCGGALILGGLALGMMGLGFLYGMGTSGI